MTKRFLNHSFVKLFTLLLWMGACKPQDPQPPQATQTLQPATKVWDKTFGGDKGDELRKLAATPDGGFLLAGSSSSTFSGDKTQNRSGSSDIDNDYWVVKIGSDGTKQWDQSFGRSLYGTDLQSAVAATDGSYLLGGIVSSVTTARDFWLVKLNADGTKQWEKTFGTPGWEDHLYGMVATADGGFLIGGHCNSNASGDKSEDNRGEWNSSDYWIIKLSADGTKQWDKTFGGSGSEDLSTIVATSDGGFLLGGTSTSNASGDKTQDGWGGSDYWVVKITRDGLKQWDKTFGGSGTENLQALASSPDGSFLLAGYSESRISGEKSQSPKGYYDYWVVKISPDGRKEWDQSYEAELPYLVGYAVTIAPTPDAGFLLGGSASVQGQYGLGPGKYWFSRFNSSGAKQWEKVLTTDGRAGSERISSIALSSDGGFVLGGTSGSNASGDKSEDSRGYIDYWVVKVK